MDGHIAHRILGLWHGTGSLDPSPMVRVDIPATIHLPKVQICDGPRANGDV